MLYTRVGFQDNISTKRDKFIEKLRSYAKTNQVEFDINQIESGVDIKIGECMVFIMDNNLAVAGGVSDVNEVLSLSKYVNEITIQESVMIDRELYIRLQPPEEQYARLLDNMGVDNARLENRETISLQTKESEILINRELEFEDGKYYLIISAATEDMTMSFDDQVKRFFREFAKVTKGTYGESS